MAVQRGLYWSPQSQGKLPYLRLERKKTLQRGGGVYWPHMHQTIAFREKLIAIMVWVILIFGLRTCLAEKGG